MGMYDTVLDFEAECPRCGTPIRELQTKDGDRSLTRYEVRPDAGPLREWEGLPWLRVPKGREYVTVYGTCGNPTCVALHTMWGFNEQITAQKLNKCVYWNRHGPWCEWELPPDGSPDRFASHPRGLPTHHRDDYPIMHLTPEQEEEVYNEFAANVTMMCLIDPVFDKYWKKALRMAFNNNTLAIFEFGDIQYWEERHDNGPEV